MLKLAREILALLAPVNWLPIVTVTALVVAYVYSWRVCDERQATQTFQSARKPVVDSAFWAQMAVGRDF